MKFQDNISNMNTYTHTYGQAETNMSPLFQSWGHNKSIKAVTYVAIATIVPLQHNFVLSTLE